MASFIKKVCLLGDPGVGKTSLIRKFVKDDFDDEYISTLGAKVSETDITIRSVEKAPVRVTLVIWDIAGQQTFSNVSPLMYMGAAGAFVVADVTRADTLENLSHWIYEFKKETKSPVIFLANKYDLLEEAESAEKKRMDQAVGKLRNLAAIYTAPVLSTSARTGENVEEAFKQLSMLMI